MKAPSALHVSMAAIHTFFPLLLPFFVAELGVVIHVDDRALLKDGTLELGNVFDWPSTDARYSYLKTQVLINRKRPRKSGLILEI